MKDIISFIKNASVIAFFVAVIVIFLPKIFSPIISEPTNYVASTIDKELRLNKLKSPKLIIVGGSGSAYSIDSKMLEDSLKIPVVNMAVAYGLGLEYMLEEVKESIGKGDKILVIPEFYLPYEGNRKLMTLVNDLNSDAYKFSKLDLLEKINFILVNFQRVGSSIFYKILKKANDENITYRSSFNEMGDMVFHLDKKNIRPLKDKEKLYNNLYNNEINHLNTFMKYVKLKDAEVFYSFPAYPITEFQANKGAINFFEKRIKEKFIGNILNSVEVNLYPEADFFDTVYHLNKNGRAKRSEYLVKTLRENLL